MIRFYDYAQALPKVIGTDPSGSPIEGTNVQARTIRHKFFTFADMAKLYTRLRGWLGDKVGVPFADERYNTSADPFGRKFYMVKIGDETYELGSVLAAISQDPGYIDAPGTLAILPHTEDPDDLELKWTLQIPAAPAEQTSGPVAGPGEKIVHTTLMDSGTVVPIAPVTKSVVDEITRAYVSQAVTLLQEALKR